MSAAVFEKHDYRKQKKRRVSLTEDFDPRPVDCRGNATSLLPALLDSVCGESLGVSLLFDPQCCHQTIPVTRPGVPDTSSLKETVSAFKESLKVSADKLREIEWNTREQHSPLCGLKSADTISPHQGLGKFCVASLRPLLIYWF